MGLWENWGADSRRGPREWGETPHGSISAFCFPNFCFSAGSGVFARDPDSLLTFTKHEEEGAFAIEMVLRNLPPVEPFVVKWDWPLFRREGSLDPTRLKQGGGRPARYNAETLLECLGDQRLTSSAWNKLCHDDQGVSRGKFFQLLKELERAGKAQKSAIDGKWHQIMRSPETQNSHYDQ